LTQKISDFWQFPRRKEELRSPLRRVAQTLPQRQSPRPVCRQLQSLVYFLARPCADLIPAHRRQPRQTFSPACYHCAAPIVIPTTSQTLRLTSRCARHLPLPSIFQSANSVVTCSY